MAYRSLTAVQPFAGGDLSSDGVLAAAVAARSFNREVILLILTSPMAAWGLNFVFGLHKQGYGHYLIASQTEQHCQALGQAWSALDQPPPPCGWATAVTHHPGWARWGLNGTVHRTALFTLRWYMSARLLDAGLNVLSLDLDGYMMADIYAVLRAPPMAQHDVVMTDVGFRRGVNCGFVYFNQVKVRARVRVRVRALSTPARCTTVASTPPPRARQVLALARTRSTPSLTAASPASPRMPAEIAVPAPAQRASAPPPPPPPPPPAGPLAPSASRCDGEG